ncbi:DUF4405 domain-containing protein [Mesorhizobium sp. M00.F.Ca.ET.149.01.1.1]|nr:DUF4405 domain-containing protein [Mesorhizobium sp. M8A.F.Ca.ET.197.01.1.1]TGR37108.1 DUF4405 domain-containing protein [bacterium M00.F.Ca.ET.199.01.1.1]TGR41607.1 DUF4405 domain-containing protein [Mesorhizobium sp. M8A.F.Ca.ET.198.01.1.1]TGV85339.1 DUF4405 domain-containing protein [Mesorhizobium sp. M00.F.Ca.ET.149.01.1.1]
MLTTRVAHRLLIPVGMAALLLLSLAYWWLDNIPHEIFGTAVFVLIAWHIAMNRLWFRNVFRGRYDGRRVFTVLLHLFLIVNMAVLLTTSIVISRSVVAFLPLPNITYLREIHWFSAYWVMIVVGIHLGIHWIRVLALLRSMLGLSRRSLLRAWTLRAAALACAGFGMWSFWVLGIWGKLTFTYSLEFWDFTASVTPFFGHWAGVLALPAILTHYVMAGWVSAASHGGRLAGLRKPTQRPMQSIG